MKCDIIIITWNEAAMTEVALKSIHDHSNFPYRLIVVDNASDAETVAMLADAERTKRFGEMLLVCNSENLGWIRGVNKGLEVADAPYVCVMNNDIVAGPNWLRNMVGTLERHPQIGLINPQERKIVDRKIIDNLFRDASVFAQEHAGQFTEIDYCSGFCVLIRRAVLEKIGKLDEAYGFGYYEDQDYSRRALAAGYTCARCLDALVLHFVSRSFGKDVERKHRISEHNRAIYEQRWGRHKHLFVLAMYPAVDDLLRLARQRYVLYVMENRFANPGLMPNPHANIKFRGSWAARLFGRVYFFLKARQLRHQGRIENAVVLSHPGSSLEERAS